MPGVLGGLGLALGDAGVPLGLFGQTLQSSLRGTYQPRKVLSYDAARDLLESTQPADLIAGVDLVRRRRVGRPGAVAVYLVTSAMGAAGVLLATEGLKPSEKGARVRMTGGKRVVVEGDISPKDVMDALHKAGFHATVK